MQKEILNLVAKNLAELDTMAEGEYPPSGRELKIWQTLRELVFI